MRTLRNQRLQSILLLVALAILLSACSSDRAGPGSPSGQSSGTTQAARPPEPALAAPPAAPQQNPAERALAAARSKTREEQKEFIANLILDGIFSQIELNEGVPRVYLRPAFRLLTPEDKHLYLAVVYAFAYPDGGRSESQVVLFDSVSGEPAGAFTPAGLQLH